MKRKYSAPTIKSKKNILVKLFDNGRFHDSANDLIHLSKDALVAVICTEGTVVCQT